VFFEISAQKDDTKKHITRPDPLIPPHLDSDSP